jgi:hypothetical protein
MWQLTTTIEAEKSAAAITSRRAVMAPSSVFLDRRVALSKDYF